MKSLPFFIQCRGRGERWRWTGARDKERWDGNERQGGEKNTEGKKRGNSRWISSEEPGDMERRSSRVSGGQSRSSNWFSLKTAVLDSPFCQAEGTGHVKWLLSERVPPSTPASSRPPLGVEWNSQERVVPLPCGSGIEPAKVTKVQTCSWSLLVCVSSFACK